MYYSDLINVEVFLTHTVLTADRLPNFHLFLIPTQFQLKCYLSQKLKYNFFHTIRFILNLELPLGLCAFAPSTPQKCISNNF